MNEIKLNIVCSEKYFEICFYEEVGLMKSHLYAYQELQTCHADWEDDMGWWTVEAKILQRLKLPVV